VVVTSMCLNISRRDSWHDLPAFEGRGYGLPSYPRVRLMTEILVRLGVLRTLASDVPERLAYKAGI
jgi:hypothetical protein